MKKNMMMRLASVLLVLTMLSTCVFGGAFAKYTTQDAASDGARVAKWGVSLQAIGNLYGEKYIDHIVANSNTGATVAAYDAASAGDDDIVAPGTLNDEGLKVYLSGKPEVSSQVTAVISFDNIYLNGGRFWGVMVPIPDRADPNNAGSTIPAVNAVNFDTIKNAQTNPGGLYIKDSSDPTKYVSVSSYAGNVTYYTLEDFLDLKKTNVVATYWPVVHTLEGDTNYSGTITDNTLLGIATAIAHQINPSYMCIQAEHAATTWTVTSQVFAPNTSLNDVINLDNEVITWEWDFGTDTPAGDSAPWTDKADTILGNLQAAANTDVPLRGEVVMTESSAEDTSVWTNNVREHYDYNLTCSFGIDITVSQVDGTEG